MKRFFFITSLLLIIFTVAGLALAEEKTSTATMTLEQALAYAEANSPQIKSAAKDLEIAKAVLRQYQADYWPTLDASASYATNEKVDSAQKADLTLTQPLFSTGIYLNYQLGKASVTDAQIAYDQALTELRFTVFNAFFGVCKAKDGIQIANDSVSLAEKNLKMVKANFDAGIVVKTDVLKMELNVANTQQGLLAAENIYQNALAQFKLVIGYNQDQSLDIVSPQTLSDFGPKPDQKPQYEARYDWQRNQIIIDKAELGVKFAKSGYLPVAAFKYNYEYTDNDPNVQRSNGDTNTFSVGLSWSFSVGGKTKAKIQESEAKLNQAKILFESTKQAAATDVLQCRLNYNESKKRTEITGLALKIAAENSNLAVKRYEAGVGTALEVSDAQVALEKAKNDELNARYDLFLAGIKLKKAMGLYKEMLG